MSHNSERPSFLSPTSTLLQSVPRAPSVFLSPVYFPFLLSLPITFSSLILFFPRLHFLFPPAFFFLGGDVGFPRSSCLLLQSLGLFSSTFDVLLFPFSVKPSPPFPRSHLSCIPPPPLCPLSFRVFSPRDTCYVLFPHPQQLRLPMFPIVSRFCLRLCSALPNSVRRAEISSRKRQGRSLRSE